MITFEVLPKLLKIVAKLDLKPIIEKVKNADIFEDTSTAEGAKKQLDREKVGLLAAEAINDILPQLGKIADDLPDLIATYKGISIEEANKLDIAEVINEFINDEAIHSFFTRALKKKAAQTV